MYIYENMRICVRALCQFPVFSGFCKFEKYAVFYKICSCSHDIPRMMSNLKQIQYRTEGTQSTFVPSPTKYSHIRIDDILSN